MTEQDGLEDQIARTYRDYAADPRKQRSWAADNPGNVAIRQELVERIVEVAAPELEGDGHILDAGCGNGWLLEELRRRGVAAERLHGMDLLPQRVEAARERVPGVDVRQGDCRALPYEDGAFGLVVMVTLLSSLPDREYVREALHSSRRALAAGGLLISYEPRLPTPNRRTRRIPPRAYEGAGWSLDRAQSLTVMPPLARGLGKLTGAAYSRLTRITPLHSHRLVALRAS